MAIILHPLRNSTTVKFDLSGIMVEPQEAALKKLKELYSKNSKIFLENVAISSNESMELFCFDRDFENGTQLDVFSSFDQGYLSTCAVLITKQTASKLGIQRGFSVINCA